MDKLPGVLTEHVDKLLEGLTAVVSSTEFWSALAGALAAGVISYKLLALQIRAGKAERKEDRKIAKAEREEERKAVHEALARSLTFKAIRITSNYRVLWRSLDDEKQAAQKRDSREEPWQFAIPLASYPDAMHFSPEEMASLMQLGNDDLFNEMLQEDQQYNTLVAAFREMDRLRSQLFLQLEADEVDETTKSSSARLKPKEAMKLRPHMLTVNDLFNDLHAAAYKRYKESSRNLLELHEIFKSEYGWEMTLQIIHKEQAEATKASLPASPEPPKADSPSFGPVKTEDGWRMSHEFKYGGNEVASRKSIPSTVSEKPGAVRTSYAPAKGD